MLLKRSLFPKISLVQKVVVGFSVAFFMVLALATLTDASRQRQLEAEDAVARTQSVIDELEKTLSVIKDAETGTRGYVITGDPTYLSPYYAASSSIDEHVARLTALVAGNSGQEALVAKLTPRIAHRLDLSKEILELRRDKGFEAAQQKVLTGEGKQEMDSIRLLIGEMQEIERSNMAQQTEMANLGSVGTSWVLAVVPFALALLVFISLQIRREMKSKQAAEQALAASETKFKAIVENTADPIYMKDVDGRYTMINKAGASIFGLTEDQIVGMNDIQFLGQEKGSDIVEKDRQVLADGVALNYESPMPHKSGTLYFNTTKFPYRSAEGEMLGLIGISRDVTAARRAEGEMRKQTEEMRALNETTLGLLNGLGIKQLLEAIVVNAAKLLGIEDTFLFVLDDDGEHMTMQSATGSLVGMLNLRIARGEGLSGKVWVTKKRVSLVDYDSWEDRVKDITLEVPRRAVGAVPLFIGSRVVGVLGMMRTGEDFGTIKNDELNLISRFGQLAALALQNSKLYAQVQDDLEAKARTEAKLLQQREELEALNETTLGLLNGLYVDQILEGIVQKASSLMGIPDSFLFVLEPDGKCLKMQSATGVFESFVGIKLEPDEGLAWFVLKSNSNISITDYQAWENRKAGMEPARMRATSEVPLRVGGAVYGVLGMSRTGDDESQFTEDEVDLLSRFGQMASVALQNSQLYAAAQQEMEERKRAEAALHELAIRDELTGLYNRREFMRLLGDEMSRCWRYKRPMSLIILDIDHFKKVNDAYGHPAGDAVLQWVSKLLKDTVRTNDRPARYGGEEFAVIVPELGGRSTLDFAERLRELVASSPCIVKSKDGEDVELNVTFSLGVAAFPIDGGSEEELIAAADRALYEAKHGGRNRAVLFDHVGVAVGG